MRRSINQRLLIGAALVALPLGGCGDDVAQADDVREPGTVAYALDWDTEGLRQTDIGWSVTNDLGYDVTLEAGWLVTYSVQLVPCETARLRAGEWLREALAALNPIQTAWAGHGDDNDISTTIGIIDDLAAPATTLRDGIALGETEYCSVHYLVARADEDVVERPDGVTLDRLSLVVSGSYARDSDRVSGEFSIETSTGFGVFRELPDGVIIGPTDAPMIRVTRSLAGIFDGVDMATVSEIDLERALVRALVESARIELQ